MFFFCADLHTVVIEETGILTFVDLTSGEPNIDLSDQRTAKIDCSACDHIR